LGLWGDRTDVGEISEQYNRVREACRPYIGDILLPPPVGGNIYRDKRIPQLKAYVEQLLAQLAAYKADEPEEASPVVDPESEPPPLWRRAWAFLNQNIVATIVGGLVVVAVGALLGLSQCTGNKPPSQTGSSNKSAAAAGNALIAPTVRFADGEFAVVKFTVVSHVAPSDAALLISVAGDRETAVSSLDAATEAAVRAVLARFTVAMAERNRTSIEQTIVAALQARYKKVGLTLDGVSLREIRNSSN
jgi:hypothetical protein